MRDDTDAFVVWVDRSESQVVDPDALAGRVEHVRSSTRARFRSPNELLRFFAEKLRSRGDPPPEATGKRREESGE